MAQRPDAELDDYVLLATAYQATDHGPDAEATFRQATVKFARQPWRHCVKTHAEARTFRRT